MSIVSCTKVAAVGRFTESNTVNLKDRYKVETEIPGLVYESYRPLFSISDIGHYFPSSLVPLCQNESKCETFHMKMSFIFMQIKVIFMRTVSHLDSL